MYSSQQTCKLICESSVPRLFEHQYHYRVGIEPIIQPLRDVEDIRDVGDVRDTEEIRDTEKKIKKKIIKKLTNNNNTYYGCIEEILRINITPITKKKKHKKTKHKKTKRNKIFSALCESSDDDEYSHHTTFSEDINYETKSVNVYDPSSVVEHKEDSDI